MRPFVATGFLGADTTYSTFAVETVMLARDGHVAVAGAYVTATLLPVGGDVRRDLRPAHPVPARP